MSRNPPQWFTRSISALFVLVIKKAPLFAKCSEDKGLFVPIPILFWVTNKGKNDPVPGSWLKDSKGKGCPDPKLPVPECAMLIELLVINCPFVGPFHCAFKLIE